jgi:hypothetical protein
MMSNSRSARRMAALLLVAPAQDTPLTERC